MFTCVSLGIATYLDFRNQSLISVADLNSMMTIILEISTEDSMGDGGLSISPGGQL